MAKKESARKSKVNWLKWIFLIAFLLILIVIVAAYGEFTGNVIKGLFGFKKTDISSASSAVMQNIVVTKANLPLFLQSTNLVQELPKGAEIQLRLYNFNSGVRVWEESYVIQKGFVRQGEAKDPDGIVSLPSSYIDKLGSFCSAVQEARNNGDLGIETKKSTASLLWKYKGMMKYKGCFGY